MLNMGLVKPGGAGGARRRNGVALAFDARQFPRAMLVINLFGGLAMGPRMARVPNEPIRLLLAVGMLGGFTMVFAFGLDAIRMFEESAVASAIGAMGLTLIGPSLG